MNIKSQAAHDMAKTVARRTGVTVTAAVELALREKIERMDRASNAEAKYQRIRQLVEFFAAAAAGFDQRPFRSL